MPDPVRLSDVFIPDVYSSYTHLPLPELTALLSSGIIAQNSVLDALARGGNTVGTVPFWNDLDPTIEPWYSNDDPEDFATPHGITTASMKYRKAYVNNSWASMDLVAELMGQNPLSQIRQRTGVYWDRQKQRRLIATVEGLLADNVANDSGDLITDASTQAIDADVFIDAEYSLGDHVGAFSGMVVHSQIAKRMAQLDMLDTEKDSNGQVIVRRYMGRVVVIDDSVPKSGTGADTVYTTLLFGAGAFGFSGAEGHFFGLGEGIPLNPVWIERQEQAGSGGGMETFGERHTWLLHPFGFSWVGDDSALVEFSPTLADLRAAGNWDRVVSRKQTPFAAIRSLAVAPTTP